MVWARTGRLDEERDCERIFLCRERLQCLSDTSIYSYPVNNITNMRGNTVVCNIRAIPLACCFRPNTRAVRTSTRHTCQDFASARTAHRRVAEPVGDLSTAPPKPGDVRGLVRLVHAAQHEVEVCSSVHVEYQASGQGHIAVRSGQHKILSILQYRPVEH